jgi:S-disulfanyl-L-cysteine oxidoreductase SoxD
MRSAVMLLAVVAAWGQSPKYGVGHAPTEDELRTWAISIAPDGKGLPPGRGTAAEGKEHYANRCAKCHGATGEGKDSVALAGGQGSLKGPKPLKTVGSYWPHATTVFDYVRRAMPFDRPGTLTNEQVYSLTAYVLYLNGLVKEGDVIDAQSLPRVRMPNREGFVADPRPDTSNRTKKVRIAR